MRIIHCRICFCTTGWLPRSERPSTTSSFASTVPRASHQFTVLAPRYTRSAARSRVKIHCVHL